jgi:hypothetical protein
MTFVESIIISESEVVYESNVVWDEETHMMVIIYGSDSESIMVETVTNVVVSTVSRSVEVVQVTTRTMVSSVLVSITFVRVEMPVYVTVISQIVLAVERPTSIVAAQVSNATLIGGVSGGLVLVVALIAFGTWFRRQGANTKEMDVDMDLAYLDDDIVASTSRSITVDGEFGKKKKRRKAARIKVSEVISAIPEEEDLPEEPEPSDDATEREELPVFQVPQEFCRAPLIDQPKPAAAPAGRRLTVMQVKGPGAAPDLWV